jgi:hypothetical protein
MDVRTTSIRRHLRRVAGIASSGAGLALAFTVSACALSDGSESEGTAASALTNDGGAGGEGGGSSSGTVSNPPPPPPPPPCGWHSSGFPWYWQTCGGSCPPDYLCSVDHDAGTCGCKWSDPYGGW